MAEIKPEELKPDWENTENFDAEVVKEAISEGDQKTLNVDTSADYDAAQQMSGGIVDAATAEKLVEPQFEVAQAEDVNIGSGAASGSANYAEMAKEVSSAPSGAGNVTDDLVEKAIAKGQPGN